MRKALLRGLTAAGALCLLAGVSYAQPTIDGDMQLGTEWVDATDQTDVCNAPKAWGDAQQFEAMYVKWDLDYLYIGISGNHTDGRVFVFVDGNANGTVNNGWLNTTGDMQDFSDPFDLRMSNLDIEFPEGFKPEICASAPASVFNAGLENGGWPNNGGVRTWNGGAADNFGWDQSATALPAGNMVVNGNAGATSQSLEIAIRWDRVFNAQSDNGDYVPGTGALPASIDGQIGILALHTSNDDNPWVSRMFLPSLLETGDVAPTGDPGNGDLVSTISTPRYLSGVRLIDVDLTDDGVLDSGNATDVGRLSLDTDPPVAIVVAGAETFFDNDMIQVTFNNDPFLGTGAEAGSALNPANYTLGSGTISSIEAGTGDRSNQVFLTLDAAIAGDVTIDVANVEDAGQTGTAPAAQFTVSPKDIIQVTLNSTGTNGFLPDPYIRGTWDNWGETGWPLANGTDPYPDVPGDQTESDDTVDAIYRGRIFTDGGLVTGGGGAHQFAIRSMYDFGGAILNTNVDQLRGLGAGYWLPNNFNRTSSSNTIVVDDLTDNRLTANTLAVTIRALVETSEGWLPTLSEAENAIMYVQAGPTYGGEGAIPDVDGDLLGEADVIGAKTLTYVGVEGNYYVYSGTVNYAAGLPDVSEYRLGFTITAGGNAGDYREAEAEFTPSDFSPAPTGVITTTVHGHVARLQSDDGTKALGRSIDLIYNLASFDVPAPPTGAPANVSSWELYN
ncbi:hypothetical protein KQI84_13755 [bacterium]|nr:hypothetical protein [bacterium]